MDMSIKKALPLVLLSLILVACILAAGCVSEDTTKTTEKKWLYSNIIGEVTPDTNVSLVDDYHTAVNKEWLSTTQIPEGQTEWNTMYEIGEKNKSKLIGLIKDETIIGHEADLVRSFYNAYMDMDKRNKDGVKPLENTVKGLENIKSIDDYKKFVADNEADILLNSSPNKNPFDSSEYILTISPSILSLGDSAEYSSPTSSGKLIKEAYSELFKKMLIRLGYTQEQADKINEDKWLFESQLASAIKTNLAQTNSAEYYKDSKIYTIDELKKLVPNLPIEEALSGYIKNGVNTVFVKEPAALQKLNELYTQENIDKIKAYILYQNITTLTKYLDEESVKIYDNTQSKINGMKYTTVPETAAYNSLLTFLKDPVDKFFVENTVDPKTKEDITAMVHSAIDIYRERLTKATWLSEETRNKAIEKLNAMTIHVIGPDDWSDYDFSSLSFDDCNSLLEIIKKISTYNNEKNYSLPGTKVDKTKWNADKSTVFFNASYSPWTNSITIYAGAAQEPVYDASASIEENYGGLYTVIAHEISHGFDSRGAQYDKDGNLNNWWAEEDRKIFTEKVKKVADYFSTIEVAPDTYVNGNYTVTEVVADLGGLSVALEAASKIPNFDYDKFFRSYAKMRRSLTSESALKQMAETAIHPPYNVRTNATVQQYEEFYNTYNVKPGDGMYLAPEERVGIW